MSNSFHNTILVVVFSYSNCTSNKDIIKTLYEKHFKKIIFYSDYPDIKDDEINFVNIKNGYFGHRIFNHLYNKYKELLNNSDGLFYTMDDNIINVNILKQFSTEKIIQNYKELKSLDKYKKWWWDSVYGKDAIYKLNNDIEFKKYNITKFCGNFSDYFYLPKKYFSDDLFKLFKLFDKYEVFLEIAIPTIINNIEHNELEYQKFTNEILWGDDRNKVLNKEYIYNSFKNNNLFIHPIKFNQNPDSKKWLNEIFNL